MAAVSQTLPPTLRETFSFYVSGRDPERILLCAEDADAVVVAGVQGPRSVQGLREVGWNGAVLFDRVGYDKNPMEVEPSAWFKEQRNAGADRLLTPGCWVSSSAEHSSFSSQILEEVRMAEEDGATCLLGIDSRWLSKSAQMDEMLEALLQLEIPVAIVLGDSSDPLRRLGAVQGFAVLTSRIDDLTVLRCDQGGIGALAFGAAHASIGLSTGHRHTVPPGVKSFAIRNDFTVRVFVRELMDWFTAGTIAGWSTTSPTLTCAAPCCSGQSMVRFLDERLKSEADLHNRTVLAALAEEVLSAPKEDGIRRMAFSRICQDALQLYGPMGGWMTWINPKPQLKQWALY